MVGEGEAISAGGGEGGGLGTERGRGGNEGGDRARDYGGAWPDMERGGSGSGADGGWGLRGSDRDG
jgi:hypothetical protein